MRLLAFIAFLLCSCTEDPDNCLVEAVRMQTELGPKVWSRLVEIDYGSDVGHIYLVFADPAGDLFAFDSIHRLAFDLGTHAQDITSVMHALHALDPAIESGRFLR